MDQLAKEFFIFKNIDDLNINKLKKLLLVNAFIYECL